MGGFLVPCESRIIYEPFGQRNETRHVTTGITVEESDGIAVDTGAGNPLSWARHLRAVFKKEVGDGMETIFAAVLVLSLGVMGAAQDSTPAQDSSASQTVTPMEKTPVYRVQVLGRDEPTASDVGSGCHAAGKQQPSAAA